MSLQDSLIVGSNTSPPSSFVWSDGSLYTSSGDPRKLKDSFPESDSSTSGNLDRAASLMSSLVLSPDQALPRKPKIVKKTTSDDLDRVRDSYDSLLQSKAKTKILSDAIGSVVDRTEVVTCPHVIFGTGDTGTTIWLEKFTTFHHQTSEKLAKRELPEVLMIGDGTGSWQHDYTLAQPHSLLERVSSPADPADFISSDFYEENPRVNARHLYQANQISLAKTEAPVLAGKVLDIQKKKRHFSNWGSKDHTYRILIERDSRITRIYTHTIDMCTGLGPAKDALSGRVISFPQFQQLSVFDPSKQFTPIVDGNQFILSDSEERSSASRVIVVYGGGGTAAACYRKAFFGHDIRTEDLPFTDDLRKHKVYWIASRGFEAAGTGKLATRALEGAGSRSELLTMELTGVTSSRIGLLLVFKTKNGPYMSIRCDQLVYSLGQDDVTIKGMTREFSDELELAVDNASGVPHGVKTVDDQIHFHGAAAMAVRTAEYAKVTWDWLHRENIGPDVGPGSMPPTRAQIKHHLVSKGKPLERINANMDHRDLIKQFLESADVEPYVAEGFIAAVLEARKESPSGFSHSRLRALLVMHGLQEQFTIQGHSTLVRAERSS